MRGQPLQADDGQPDEANQEASALQGPEEETLQNPSREAGKPGQSNMTHMDFLSNPLRSDHPFGKFQRKLICSEIWSPKEIALFMHCMCRFEKEFDVFVNYVSAEQGLRSPSFAVLESDLV